MAARSIDVFCWNDHFDTGLPTIDEQHRELVRTLNRLAAPIAVGADPELLGQVFSELPDYVARHFASEEALWHEYLADDPAEAEHQASHRSFARELALLDAARLERPAAEVTAQAIGFLARWLVAHILGSDRYLACVVRARQEGLPLQAAMRQAREQMASATGKLTDIVLAVYAALSTNALEFVRELTAHQRDRDELLQARRQLEDSEVNLRGFFNTIDDFLFVLDEEARILRVNHAVLARLGYAETELVGQSALLLHPSETHEEVVQTIAELRAGTRDSCLIPLRAADGRLVPVETRLVVGRWNGRPALFGVSRDISAHRLMARELSESKRVLQTVLDAVPMRIFWKDKDSRFLGCNPLFACDAGKSDPAELIGQDDRAMAWAAQADLYRADDRRVMESGVAKLNFEEPQTTPDGRKIYLRTSKVPLRNDQGETFGVIGIYDDITEYKLAEEQRRSQLDELRRWQAVMLDREDRILDLKREVNELLTRLQEPPRYRSVGALEDPR